MQIRTLEKKELDTAFEMIKNIYHDIDFNEFVDLVYEMPNYILVGAFFRGDIKAIAGIEVKTTLKDKRHIRVYEIYGEDEKSLNELKTYLDDFKKLSACEKIVYEES